MSKKKVVDLDEARERIYRRREREVGAVCPKCGKGGAAVYAHIVHCSNRTTEEKIKAMTGHYGLDAEGARETVERWEAEAEVREFRARGGGQGQMS